MKHLSEFKKKKLAKNRKEFRLAVGGYIIVVLIMLIGG